MCPVINPTSSTTVKQGIAWEAQKFLRAWRTTTLQSRPGNERKGKNVMVAKVFCANERTVHYSGIISLRQYLKTTPWARLEPISWLVSSVWGTTTGQFHPSRIDLASGVQRPLTMGSLPEHSVSIKQVKSKIKYKLRRNLILHQCTGNSDLCQGQMPYVAMLTKVKNIWICFKM